MSTAPHATAPAPAHDDADDSATHKPASTMNALRTKNVAVIGGSYVGHRLAMSLAKALPATHRVVLIESNSHFHHLFTLPRFSVLHRGGEEKAFVPYDHIFSDPSIPPGAGTVVHARALSILPSSGGGEVGGTIRLDRPLPNAARPAGREDDGEGETNLVAYDYLALATGTQLQRPWSLSTAASSSSTDAIEGEGNRTGEVQDTTKAQAIQILQSYQDKVRDARRIVIVGGGAVGVQVALDIAHLYPLRESGKEVVVVHSRDRVMNKYHQDLHNLVMARFGEAGIETILSSRVHLPSPPAAFSGGGRTHMLPLSSGSSVSGDLILLCTGQTPRSALLRHLSPSSLTAAGFIKVDRTLQVQSAELEPGQAQRLFALGDVAETGAWKTVRAAMGQIDTVSHNILALISRSSAAAAAATAEGDDAAAAKELKTFTPGPAGIHLTLGLRESVKFGNPANPDDKPRCLVEEDGSRDMNASRMWANFNVPKDTAWHL
ncbi:uncharacterized protein PFL1_04765 [Pseudozyma flocculosa PF-1]|uniref:Related to AIF1 - mitochondrial cell death effector n=2 Tax=Pseudozyma flocculosa TaxID=84751 RepID=A0A5C3F413_9BASI|nr:uncharacterized protein PFL1_04765 [Pseudozyma flocculosa PF-1]EPQ27627.1 hypothetical protein PFL1_04765 [Pseudozyma flocculosa PF-1]SPO39243.1 related to AIF1 - mitochondrial cell death effector [Pseudozyma flocculosa]